MHTRASLIIVATLVILPAVAAGQARFVGSSEPGDADWDLFRFERPRGASQAPFKAAPEPYFPYLPDEPSGRSISIGTVTDGYITHARLLPLPGATYAVLPRQFHRHLLYGSDELIQTLVSASEYVAAAHPGAILWLGNIGRHGGGDIPYSVSHNAGRDADLAFYTVDPDGRPVMPPDLLHYDDRGRSREYGGYYRFDVARNWSLVKGLILSPHAQIQYLFVSNGLRRLLLEHAESRGEPAALVDAARRVLSQPGPSIPHDDHLHVRVYCSRADVGGGCENFGRVHPGIDLFDDARRGRAEQAASMLRSPEAETRARAIERLVVLDQRGRLDDVRRRFSDPSARVRSAAAEAIAALGTTAHVPWLVEQWEEEDDPEVREALLRGLGALGGADAAAFLASTVQTPQPGTVRGKAYDLRLVAVEAMARTRRPEPAAMLVALLDVDDGALRAAANDALRRLTNQSPTAIDFSANDPAQLASGRAAWRAWYEDNGQLQRRSWLDDGFAAAGYGLAGGARQQAAVLARAAGDDRLWVRENAQRELFAMTGNHARSLDWPADDARAYWTRWVSRNGSSIRSR